MLFQPAQYAHWHQFFEGVPLSPTAVYDTLEQDFKAHKLPDTETSRITHPEGGMLSASRVYLKVERDWLKYHICVAPFGTGFFVSSRLLVSAFGSWPIIAGICGLVLFIIFMVFLVVAGTSNSGLVGMLAAGVCMLPTLLFLAVVVILWVVSCLRLTWYRLDTMLAFHEAVHRILVARINQVVEATGHRPLTDQESKPILHKLLER